MVRKDAAFLFAMLKPETGFWETQKTYHGLVWEMTPSSHQAIGVKHRKVIKSLLCVRHRRDTTIDQMEMRVKGQ